jgi:hypothetical protein
MGGSVLSPASANEIKAGSGWIIGGAETAAA